MKTRILGAILIILIFIPILLLGGMTFAIAATVLALGAMYELIHIRQKEKKFPFIVKLFAYVLIIIFLLMNYKQDIFSYNMDYHMIALLIFAFLFPILFMNKKEDVYNINDALYLIGALLFLTISFNLLLLIRNYSLNYLIYLLLITTMTDVFAFLTGKYIGKHKLSPTISPNKTWEGFVGGLLMGTFVATTFYTTVIDPHVSLVLVIFVTAFLSVVGQMGDLVFSSIKRTFKTKDYSNIIPGHGGILDRFDSLIFVVLAFVLVFGII